MFSSVSSCTPNSHVTTEFVASTYTVLEIWSNVSISVNGNVTTTRPIELFAGDRIIANVATPVNYLDYKVFPYTTNSLQQYFAVATRNDYQPLVKTPDNRKRWYNYVERDITVSFWQSPYKKHFYLGSNRNFVDVDSLHIVLDHLNYKVLFYSTSHDLVSSVKLAGGPIEYKKISYTVPVIGTYTQDLLVLCNNGKLYRIRFDNYAFDSDKFEPYVLSLPQLDNLPFNEDVPGVGSFTDLARRDFLRMLFPAVKAIDVSGNTVWIAGGDKIYITNLDFVLLDTITVSEEDVVNLSCLGSDAVIVTRLNRVYRVTRAGAVTLLHTALALGGTGTLPDGQRVAVPDPNNRRILVFSANGSFVTWATPDFAPAYCRTFGDKLWVTGHDTNRVYSFTNSGHAEYIDFNYKTALISIQGNSYLGIHCLRNFVTLDLTGINKIIPFTFTDRTGGLTHIGTTPIQVTMLGQEGITPIAGPRITTWINGSLGLPLNSNDYLGISYRGGANGRFRSFVIIGENVIDYTVTVTSSRTLKDYFLNNVVANKRLTPVYGEFTPLDVGDTNEGYTGPFPLGFPFVLYNTIYTEFTVSTNGYITFGNNFVINSAPSVGSLGVDALYPYPVDLLQDYPVDNTDPLNIKSGRLDTAEKPGLYYKYESLGAFLGIRLRWVGTPMKYYPLGNVKSTRVTTISSNLVPLNSIVNFNIGDYVSGNGITASTQVTDQIVYNQDFTAYYASGNVVRVIESVSSTLPYSDVIDKFTGNLYGYTESKSSFFHQGNVIIAREATTYILSGHEPAEVNTGVVFEFKTPSANIIGANSITRTTGNITSLGSIYPDNRYGSSLFYVSKQDYDAVYLNENLSAPTSNANLVVTTSAAVSDKDTYVTEFRLTANSSQKAEGRVIRFELVANIAFPWLDEYQWAITGDVDTSDFAAYRSGTNYDGYAGSNPAWSSVTSLSGNIKLSSYSSSLPARGFVDFVINQDGVAESLETYAFTVSNLSIYNYSLSVSSQIKDTGVDSTFFPTDSITANEYVITSNVHPYMWNSNGKATYYRTNITFDSYSGNHQSVDFSFNEITLSQPNLSAFSPSTININANYAVITPAASITSNTSLLFKANIVHPAIVYETGIYVGEAFQYVEYFYDTLNHDSNVDVGIAKSNHNNIFGIVSTRTQANSSVLFGSEESGNFELVGTGSFTEISRGYSPRYPRLLSVDTSRDTELTYNYIIDTTVPSFANIKASLNYGELRVNDGEYTGTFNIDQDMTISVTVPFNTTLKSTAPILSLGDFQITIPAAPGKIYNNITTSQLLLDDQPLLANASATITVPVAGEYLIPDFYRIIITSAGQDLVFEKIVSGNATVLTKGVYHTFNTNDQIRVTRQILSSRRYDVREIVIPGPRFLKITFRTLGDRRFNSLNYGTLVEPFARYYDDFDVVVREPNQTVWPHYRTGNIKLSGNGMVTSRLFVDAVGVNFLVNGNLRTNFIPSITTGANVALEWTVPNYFAANAIIYQVQVDSYDNSNIYVPVGSWNIQNRTIDSAALIDYNLLAGPSGMVEFVSAQTYLPMPAIVADFARSATTLTEQFTSEYTAGGATIIGGAIAAQYQVPGTVFISIEPITAEHLGRTPTFFVGQINGQYLGSVAWDNAGQITALNAPYSQTTLVIAKIAGEHFSFMNSYLIKQIGSEAFYPGYTVITTGSIQGQYSNENPYSFVGAIQGAGSALGMTEIIGAISGSKILAATETLSSTEKIKIGIETTFSGTNTIIAVINGSVFNPTDYKFVMVPTDVSIDTDIQARPRPTEFTGQSLVSYQVPGTEFTGATESYGILITEIEIDSLPKFVTPHYIHNILFSEFAQNSVSELDYFDVAVKLWTTDIYWTNNSDRDFNTEVTGISTFDAVNYLGNQIPFFGPEILVDQLIEYPFGISDVTAYDLIEIPFGSDFFEYNQVQGDLVSDFMIVNLQGFAIDSEYWNSNQIENSFDAEFVETNDTYVPLEPLFEIPTLIPVPFVPVLWREPLLPVPFIPVLWRAPFTPSPYVTVLWREPELLIDIDPLFIRQQYIGIDLLPDFYRDIMWTSSEFTEQGAVSTDMRLWGDHGRDSDYILFQNQPLNTVNRRRGPFVQYNYSTGSSVLSTHVSGTVYLEFYGNGDPITTGNTVIHSNGLNYFYDSTLDAKFVIDSYYDPGLSITVTSNTITVVGGANNVVTGTFTGNLVTTGGKYYGAGSYATQQAATEMAGKYVSASAVQILGTDYWNYRIHFGTRVVCTPRRGTVFPRIWLIRGG
jgi:hypothetical protein